MKKRKKIKYKISGSCWICTSHAIDNGYPVISINGKKRKLSRYIFEKKHGPIKKGIVIRHICDNPLCINPKHLIPGTQADNINDKVKRGRTTKGEDSPLTLLSNKKVKEMLKEANKSISYLSDKYGISHKTVSNILSGKSFKHLLPKGYRYKDRRKKLSNRQKIEIKKSSEKNCILAKIYGVSEAMISILKKE